MKEFLLNQLTVGGLLFTLLVVPQIIQNLF